MNIFAGNLSQAVTEEDLRKTFGAFGKVAFVNIVKNWRQKTSAGFGYLDMPVPEQAQAAVEALHGKELKGQILTVNVARPRTLQDPTS